MRPGNVAMTRSLTCMFVWLLLAVAVARPGDDDNDGYVILQLEDTAAVSVSSLPTQIGDRDLLDCQRFEFNGWAACKLAPAAAEADVEANRVVQALASLETVAYNGATVSSAGTRRRVFRRVGRGKKVYPAARSLLQAQQDALDALVVASANRDTAAAADRDTAAAATAAGTAAAAYPATDPAADADASANSAVPAECPKSSCPEMWGMNRIRAPALWKQMGAKLPLTITRAGAIIDTGADVFNNNIGPQLDKNNSITITSARQWSQDSDRGAAGKSNHGSHVFGVAAGAWGGNDPTGVAGVLGPALGKIVSCNVFGQNGDKDGAAVSDIVKCLAHARKVNAHWVINLSLGGEWDRTGETAALLRDALNQYVCAAGGIAVVAAHNYGVNVDNPANTKATFPAAFAGQEVPCLVAVGASDNRDQLASFSNYGRKVKIVAPGKNIVSSVNSVGGALPWAVGSMDGTSMASPHVAGSALLLMNAFPSATNIQVLECLINTATDPVGVTNPSAVVGGGILNVQAAYGCVQAKVGVDCTSGELPSCVDGSSGVPDPACQAGNASYCQQLGSTICRYSLKSSTSLCNATETIYCTGTQPMCPPAVEDKPTDPQETSCEDDKLQECQLPGLCTSVEGCHCSSSTGKAATGNNTSSCTCATSRGFVQHITPQGVSKCRWNVTFRGGRWLQVPPNSNVALPLALGDAGLCPPDGTKVVQSLIISERVQCPRKAHKTLAAVSQGLGESCGQYVVSTTKEGATAGSCYRVQVATTDRRSYNLIFIYS